MNYSPFLLWPMYGVLGFCVAAVLFKALLASCMPDSLRFQVVDVNHVPRLDAVALQNYTEQFLRLGFVWLGDIANTSGIAAFSGPATTMGSAPIPAVDTAPELHKLVPGFCRVFAHPEHGCLAEAYQHFPPNMPNPPLRITVSSLMTDGWDITTSNRKPEAIMYALRRPRGVRTTHPDAEAWKLLGAHQEIARRVAQQRGVTPMALSRLEDYVEQERRVMIESKAALKKRNAVGMLWEVMTFGLQPKREWLGAAK